MATRRSVVWAAIVAALVSTSLTAACATEGVSSSTVGVVVTIPPQAEFAESVGADLVDVAVMVPPGASPHTHEPTPTRMKDVADAAIYAKVGSGVEFELSWLDRILAQSRDILVVDCAQGVSLRRTPYGEEGQDQTPGATDPHVWMTPANAMIMVGNIADGLIEVDPNNRAYYEGNRDSYLQQLEALDRDIRSAFSGIPDSTFIVYHDSFGYFADEYGLTMLPIEVEGKQPTESGLIRLVDEAREHDVKVILASPQFSLETPEVIAAEIGASVVVIDSLAEDYVANMRAFLEELVQAIER
jgi:zinc transport system substrate-binding protein